ncbi:MAG TPA: NEW3 domain-containing protein [Hypericibacter adhaerens]|uniref:NEW3 domain-containing protein n=1 Tax=Hypericibacter adhaerens TaxID=2602016 RepID=UPI002C2DB3FE|nr:NEW3 domain-containing protein [Hypericibacter adhaerens]HWA43991.1 NEW3 domain-containing protein [Hypericibacter adhaerens]
MPSSRLRLAALLAALALCAAPALAQTSSTQPALTGFWLTTPYPELTIPAGEKGSIPLTLRNAGLPPQRAELAISGLPSGWTADFTGGGKPVTAAIVDPNDTQSLTLEVTPPKDASDKAAPVEATVTAKYGDQTASLPLAISLSTEAPGGVTLTPELPALRGTPTTDFSFRIKIDNNSGADQLFNLGADVPAGFTTSFKHGYDTAEITGVPIKAGASDTVTMDVKPGPNTAAGDYPLRFAVLAGKLTASTDLGVRITGTPGLSLSGPQDRLSGDTTAGQPTTFPFTLESTGSAPAQNVKLSASAPSDWKVTFDPETLPALEAGQSQTVNVTITPSAKAVAGDYIVSVSANADGASRSADFRATVNTSTQWGIVGVIIIAAALIVLVVGVMRYGRR